MTTGITLTPLAATGLFVIAVVAGYRYRQAWKNDGPAWEKWVSGAVAAACFLALAFLPLKPG